MSNEIERWEDLYELPKIKDKDVFDEEIGIMEANSQWVPGIPSKDIRVTAIPSPIEAPEFAANHRLDLDKTQENIAEGTKLVLDYGSGEFWNVSGIARRTLCETAKLQGSSLGRLHQIKLEQSLNNSLEVARGTTLMLLRYGKVMALHSDAAGGYCPMPISRLVLITEQVLQGFGQFKFSGGYHSNSYTQATWDLIGAQNDLLDAYQKALANAVSNVHGINFMPVVRLSASDTAHSAAILAPMFRKSSGAYIQLVPSISVKHEKGIKRVYGLDLFEQEAGKIFARFKESAEVIQKMAQTEIFNPVNCTVGIFNYLNKGGTAIPRKYADAAREEIERFAINTPVMSFHDIYISMSECISAAQNAGASKASITNIEEALAKVATLTWSDFDVGGVVAWGDVRSAA